MGKGFPFVSLSFSLPFWVRYIQDRHRGDQLAMTDTGVSARLLKHLSLIDRILSANEGDQLVQVYEPKMQCSEKLFKDGNLKLLNLDWQPQFLHSQMHFPFISWLRAGAQAPNHWVSNFIVCKTGIIITPPSKDV